MERKEGRNEGRKEGEEVEKRRKGAGGTTLNNTWYGGISGI